MKTKVHIGIDSNNLGTPKSIDNAEIYIRGINTHFSIRMTCEQKNTLKMRDFSIPGNITLDAGDDTILIPHSSIAFVIIKNKD